MYITIAGPGAYATVELVFSEEQVCGPLLQGREQLSTAEYNMSHAGMPSICNLLALSGATVDPTATHKLNEEKLDVCKGCLICSGSGYLIDGLTARYKSTDMTQ